MRILYYSPSSYGGLADYSHEQANALAQMGITVDFLCTPNYPTDKRHKYNLLPHLEIPEPKRSIKTKIGRAWRYVHVTLTNYRILSKTIKQGAYKYVLIGAYAEYLAPLWARQLRHLAKKGTVFGAVIHDPIRDFVLGPIWWHRRSISASYSFLSEAFVHEDIRLEASRKMPQLKTTVVPHGPYYFSEPSEAPHETRSRLQIPEEAPIMLAFGHIRANKNLDLVIKAMAQVPDLYLLVAGKALQKDCTELINQYQELAKQLKVSHRCRWENTFIPETSVANFFQAADLVLLTYNRTFHSASGVLSAAVGYRKPCLASAGEGPLKSVMQKYQLGVWVEPDNLQALVEGLNSWLENRTKANWSRFLQENSWQRNAQLVADRLGFKEPTQTDKI